MTDYSNKNIFDFVGNADNTRDATEVVQDDEGNWVRQKNTTTFAPGKLPILPPDTVHALNVKFKGWIDRGWITAEEGDALRHYYGVREMAKNFGSGVSKAIARIHEFQFPNSLWGEDHPQSEVDRVNNDIALEHFNNKVGSNWNDSLKIKDVKLILEDLVIPPKTDLSLEDQQKYVDDAIYNLYNKRPEPESLHFQEFMKEGSSSLKSDIHKLGVLLDETEGDDE